MNNKVMKRKTQKSQRVFSLILCLFICLSLLPVIPAVAVEGPEIFTGTLDTDVTKVAGFDAGHVLKYSTLENGVIKVEVGVYNVLEVTSYNVRFKYDPEVVSLVKNSAGTATEEWDGIVGILDANTSLIPETLYKGGPPRNGATWVKHTENTAYLPFEYTLTNEWDNTTGKIKLELQSKDATAMQKMKPYYVDGFINDTVDCTFAQEGFTSLYSLYFKVNEGKSISENTLGLYVDPTDNVCPDGVRLSDYQDNEKSKKALLLGFPQAAATTYNVPFEVTATAATDNKVYLPNPAEVTITKQGGGVAQNYKSNAKGELLTAAGAALNPKSTLALEAGTYDYTVTPTGKDLDAYAANSGTFTVNINDTTQKQLHAKLISEAAEETYSFHLFDGESAKDDVPLADAVVQVGGVTATNNNGAISFQAIPGTSPTINISKNDYKTLSGNVTVGATGTGTITSMSGITFKDGAVVMDQTRTNVTIEAKDGTTALADAIITVSAKPQGTVTPNMAANELPIVKKADAAGKVSFNLPNGDYIYTIRAGGYSDTVKSLAIAEKVTVAEKDGTNPQPPIEKGTPSAEGDFTVEIPAASAGTPGAITEPMYYVVGKLDKEENPSKMTVEVYLKNAKALNGTFGLKYDPAMFKLAAGGFVQSTKIEPIVNYPMSGKGTISNPVSASGYHAFYWQMAGSYLDATGTAELIATYTLELQPGFSKDKLHSKSLCVAPYSKTDAATQILNAYEGNAAYANEFINTFWRPIDAANNAPTDTHRLPAALATEGGFYQICVSGTGSMLTSDARAQFVFDNSGAVGVTFSVNETADGATAGAPVPNATIKIKDGEKLIKTLTTDQYGDVTVGLPVGGSYTYTVTCLGYQPKTDIAVPANTDPISVLLSADESHKVRVDNTQIDKIDLLGANRAQNLMDYPFNLQPKAGYKWVSAGGPTPAQISFKLTDGTNTTTIDSSNITWDAVASCYKLAGTVITGDAKQDLVVSVATEAITSTTASDAPTITVKAIGDGGKFDVTPDADRTSTFDPAVTADMTAVVETLGAGKGTSATYAFKEGGPVTGGQTPAEGTYEAYIIHKLLINGAEVQLTDTQKIHGVSQQLIGVNNNQTITAIYEKATVDLKGPGDEDDVILPQPPIVPTANPLVSIILGEGGSAAMTVTNPSVTGTVTGPGRAEYEVKATDGTLTAVITPDAALAQPGGGTKEYVIDTVAVDGVKVNDTTPAATWNEGTKTLTLTNLAAGATHTVAVTFRPSDATESTEAILNTVHVDGNGKITPLGTNIYKVGDCPTVQFVPDAQWVLGKLELTVPSGTGTDVTDKVENNAYKLSALAAGTTVLEYTFKEQSFTVELSVDYLSGIKPMTGATIIFERSAGNGLPVSKLEFEMAAPTGSQVTGRFEVPEGTWKVTLKKHGFLPYTVTGFTIDKDGNAAGTYKDDEGVLHFGMATKTSELKRIKPIIGDANRDEILIALDDAAQIIEGMVSGASQGSKDYADVDENGEVNAADQGYVSGNFGKRAIVRTYTDFLAK